MTSANRRLKNLKAICVRTAWYRQGVAAKPFYIGYPWGTCARSFTICHRPIGLYYRGFTVYLARDYMEVFFARPVMHRIARYYLTQQKHNFRFGQKLRKHWEQHDVPALTRAIKDIESRDLEKLPQTRLVRLFLNFSVIYEQLWRESIFLDSFDVVSDEILDEFRNCEKSKISQEDLHILTSSEQLSWLQREKQDLLKLVSMAERMSELGRIIKNGAKVKEIEKLSPSFSRLLKEYASRWQRIRNDYAVVKRLSTDFFLKEIRALLRDKKKLSEERDNLRQVGKSKRRKQSLLKRFSLSADFVRTVNLLILLAEWRDSRKAANQQANGALAMFAREFSRRLGVSRQELEYLFWREVKNAFVWPKEKLRKIAKKRQAGAFFIDVEPAKTQAAFYGEPARQLRQIVSWVINDANMANELKGRPAFPGRVRGRVKVILNQSDFRKMSPGDILVAPNTRPEYVPIMKIAGAIITEEGGITSHAAILARELKIPCLVGVQGAVSLLRDGERVEVDAGKGTIKKIV